MNYARLRFSTLVGLLSLFSLVYADNKGVTPLELKNHTGLFIGKHLIIPPSSGTIKYL